MSEAIDTFNKFGVALHGKSLVMLNPPSVLTAQEALLLAAYLVSMAPCAAIGECPSFESVLEAVQST